MGTTTITIGGNPVSITSDKDLTTLQEKQMWKRAERNGKLAETDVYMVSDFPITTEQKTAWQTYRKALRDMDFSDPDNITWPTKPE
tara:strand:+ start:3421 stop:3678 length:258 start_codon:yes stop_codon:yes gene_type:complete